MNARKLCLLVLSFSMSSWVLAQKALPSVHDGVVLSGPGEFRHDGELLVEGRVTLRHMTLHLHGPIRVAAGATLELDDVHLLVSDEVGAPNGTSGLRCEGPAHVAVLRSTMVPEGAAHPMWQLKGDVDVDSFDTTNSEFHLDHTQARLKGLKIFELEISRESRVTAHGLELVFLSTHTGEEDHLRFEDVPVNRTFTRALDLGSGAHAELTDARIQYFLLYVHGRSSADLSHMDRVQLALSPDCEGTLRLLKGRLGSASEPEVFPKPHASNCPFHIGLNDVNVDTWDVYAGGHAKLTLNDSQIDELIASDHADITVLNSKVYADWLGVNGDARMTIENSTVGALSLAGERPDLATSQIRVTGRGHATFTKVRFDCGIVAEDDGFVSIAQALRPPKYMRKSGQAAIQTDGSANQ
ncbi:MAG TPA: hypothetical protein VN753_08260 [Terracidiphilus sp.]|nr:hypothetical protein [Terracidiphilus sp.]